jgi:peptide deformylase
MTPKSIVRMGDPVLRRVAEPVADATAPEIRELIADMEASLADAGGIGLAAPQIGVPSRVLIFRVPYARATDHPDEGP